MANVYIVRKNADQTEGRGPMVIDKVFDDLEAAFKFAPQTRHTHRPATPYSPETYSDGAGWQDMVVYPISK